MAIPYASATSGEDARKEITKILRRFGCEEIGFMDNYNEHEVLLAFKHRGRAVTSRRSRRIGSRTSAQARSDTPSKFGHGVRSMQIALINYRSCLAPFP
jgi:hypothetical protein